MAWLSSKIWASKLLGLAMSFQAAASRAGEPGAHQTPETGKTSLSAKLILTVLDDSTGRPIPCRIHLKDSADKAQRQTGVPFWFDHISCPGSAEFELPAGEYTLEIEHGPEYTTAARSIRLRAGEINKRVHRITRLADLRAEGWRPGDLHVHRPVADIELLMRAEDLHLAPVITWWNNTNLWDKRPLPEKSLVQFDGRRFYDVMAGEDEREGGALLYFHLPRPLTIAGAGREYPSPMRFVEAARKHKGVWIDIEKPFWWDVPVWLASGQMNSIGLANNHMCRDRMYESEAWGKPRIAERLPPPHGNGYWSQEIYYHILNSGLRLPPSAGSASGVLPNPVGYNRVYVHTGRDDSAGAWWENLRQGRCFVTNGPLLRVKADGRFPGHVFKAGHGQPITVQIDAKVTSRDPIKTVEIIKNGKVELRIPVPPGRWPRDFDLQARLAFRESGWFLVRAIADNAKTFRFASSAPYFVEVGAQGRRISRASVQFFVDWIRERVGRVKLASASEKEAVLAHHRQAERFWQALLKNANAE